MKLLEHQGKKLLFKYDIAVPEGRIVANPEEAAQAAAVLGGECVLKAQIPATGRGKAGGIVFVGSPGEAQKIASDLLGKEILGFPVETLLVEQKLNIVQELFISLVIDANAGKKVAIFSTEGGVNIECVAAQTPEKLFRLVIDGDKVPPVYKLRPFLRQGGLKGRLLEHVTQALFKLMNIFVQKDLLLAEINPLAVLSDGSLIAGDAKIEVDNSALYRQDFSEGVWEESGELEEKARSIGVSYIKLDGTIGVIASGAGLGMCSMDLLDDAGHPPANFLETGGGISEGLMYNAVQLVCSHEKIKGLLINLYGGINPIEKGALGIVRALNEMERPPVTVVKALGNKQEECWSILNDGGITVVSSVRTEDAVQRLAELLAVKDVTE